jgi:DinB superfamily
MDSRLVPVLAETNANRATFEAFCRSLTADELARDVPDATWQVKDYITHLATIDIWVGDWFGHLADGKVWAPLAEDGGPFNIDTWNEREVVARRSRSIEQLLAEAAVHRAALLDTWERFTPAVLDATFKFRGPEITFLRYLELWATHDPAHTQDMLRAIPERAK